jgi:hypothetical protein
MAYQKEFFVLQFNFAMKVQKVLGLSFEESVRLYTGFYKYFNIPGWDFSKDDVIWQEYINLVTDNVNPVDVSYQFYLDRIHLNDNETTTHPKFGCFSYEFEEKDNAIQIHFTNRDEPEPGALSKERMEVRIKELTELFHEVKRRYPEIKEVWGFSWLYNLESYRRLFPPNYVESRTEIKDWFKSNGLWGQFLNKYGFVKDDLAEEFFVDIQNAHTFDDLRGCFPFLIQELVGDPKEFYMFYKIP